MDIRFLKPAQRELDEAVDYYNSEVPGVGDQFLLEVLKTLDRICDYPDAWHPFSDDTRRCRTRRFPYALIYQARDDEILIIAVMHLHRKPDYWRQRNK
ncbi:type II toxin-antitoxin system RelE/ParE family toxin [Microbulbifer halophilus]|uniref:Type II toxin-antitoxin system RelE/ParE family toxin n=1 Tax=Microbulbifer halophilus TaxID=453963 RepID=A0ABW5EFQ4_9GAMM|nr:type II toxin-antitoxin system RelE/ParE family toxin [Microbulbifer halophilus]MCW8125126.1 type II toxin-antitoxin system RelE/ParE family toxin [Microbulbifer halophilus]